MSSLSLDSLSSLNLVYLALAVQASVNQRAGEQYMLSDTQQPSGDMYAKGFGLEELSPPLPARWREGRSQWLHMSPSQVAEDFSSFFLPDLSIGNEDCLGRNMQTL